MAKTHHWSGSKGKEGRVGGQEKLNNTDPLSRTLYLDIWCLLGDADRTLLFVLLRLSFFLLLVIHFVIARVDSCLKRGGNNHFCKEQFGFLDVEVLRIGHVCDKKQYRLFQFCFFSLPRTRSPSPTQVRLRTIISTHLQWFMGIVEECGGSGLPLLPFHFAELNRAWHAWLSLYCYSGASWPLCTFWPRRVLPSLHATELVSYKTCIVWSEKQACGRQVYSPGTFKIDTDFVLIQSWQSNILCSEGISTWLWVFSLKSWVRIHAANFPMHFSSPSNKILFAYTILFSFYASLMANSSCTQAAMQKFICKTMLSLTVSFAVSKCLWLNLRRQTQTQQSSSLSGVCGCRKTSQRMGCVQETGLVTLIKV